MGLPKIKSADIGSILDMSVLLKQGRAYLRRVKIHRKNDKSCGASITIL
jgi:hypothetical protein